FGGAGRGELVLTLSIHSPWESSPYVWVLFAFQSARPSVVSVTQPTCTLLRTSQGATATAAPASTSPETTAVARARGSLHTMYAAQRIGTATRRVLPRIASPLTMPSSAAIRFDGRCTTTSVSRTSAAAHTWSTISRLTCTSCHARYGLSVAIAA